MNGRIDWEAARRRLAEAEAALSRTDMTDEQRDAILAWRAAQLAAPPPPPAPADAFEAVVFALGDEHYAFPSTQVREVRPPGDLTPLMCTSAFVAGLVNVRGRVVPVLDLGPLFGLPGTGESAQAVMLLSCPRGDVGILTSNRPALRQLRAGELGGLPAGAAAGLAAAYVRGVTPDTVVVLDAERLLADQRLVVQEEG